MADASGFEGALAAAGLDPTGWTLQQVDDGGAIALPTPHPASPGTVPRARAASRARARQWRRRSRRRRRAREAAGRPRTAPKTRRRAPPPPYCSPYRAPYCSLAHGAQDAEARPGRAHTKTNTKTKTPPPQAHLLRARAPGRARAGRSPDVGAPPAGFARGARAAAGRGRRERCAPNRLPEATVGGTVGRTVGGGGGARAGAHAVGLRSDCVVKRPRGSCGAAVQRR